MRRTRSAWLQENRRRRAGFFSPRRPLVLSRLPLFSRFPARWRGKGHNKNERRSTGRQTPLTAAHLLRHGAPGRVRFQVCPPLRACNPVPPCTILRRVAATDYFQRDKIPPEIAGNVLQKSTTHDIIRVTGCALLLDSGKNSLITLQGVFIELKSPRRSRARRGFLLSHIKLNR